MCRNRLDHKLFNTLISKRFFVSLSFCFIISGPFDHVSAYPDSIEKEEDQKRGLDKKELSHIWTTIKTTPASNEKKFKEGKAGTNAFWYGVMDVGFVELKKIVYSANVREGLKYYVSQFGKNDALTDFRWLIAARRRLLPADTEIRPHIAPKEIDLMHAELYFAEYQVRQFLEKPKLLARYYQSVIWYDQMFSDLFFPVFLGQVIENMKTGSSDEYYWWYAQNFMLMAHATGRDDLLKGAKPEDLKPRFQIWYRWFVRNGMYLRASPDSFYWRLNPEEPALKKVNFQFMSHRRLPVLKVRPQYPFPDWEGPKPLTPEDYLTAE